MMDSGAGFGLGDIWGNLPPEQRQKALSEVLRLGTLNQQNDTIEQQIKQAVQGQQTGGQRHYGAAGGAIGGIGEGLGAIANILAEKRAREQQATLLPQLQAGREKYAQSLLGGGAIPQGVFGDPNQNQSKLPGGY